MEVKTLTFAFDCQLNDREDWIPEGSVVTVSNNEFYLKRHEGFTPVIITEARNFKGNKIKVDNYLEWFSNGSFVELMGVNKNNIKEMD